MRKYASAPGRSEAEAACDADSGREVRVVSPKRRDRARTARRLGSQRVTTSNTLRICHTLLRLQPLRPGTGRGPGVWATGLQRNDAVGPGGTANLAVLGGNLPPGRTQNDRSPFSARIVRSAVGRVARQNGPVARSTRNSTASFCIGSAVGPHAFTGFLSGSLHSMRDAAINSMDVA